MLFFPLAVMDDGDSKIERRLGERLSVIVGGCLIFGGMILLLSPLPWDLRDYMPSCYEHSEYRQTFQHEGNRITQRCSLIRPLSGGK